MVHLAHLIPLPEQSGLVWYDCTKEKIVAHKSGGRVGLLAFHVTGTTDAAVCLKCAVEGGLPSTNRPPCRRRGEGRCRSGRRCSATGRGSGLPGQPARSSSQADWSALALEKRLGAFLAGGRGDEVVEGEPRRGQFCFEKNPNWREGAAQW